MEARLSVRRRRSGTSPGWGVPLAALALALAPLAARAHEKWFTDPASHPTDWSLVLSERTAIAVVAIGILLVVFATAQRLLGDPHWPRLWLFSRMAAGATTLLAVQTAITLIAVGVSPALLSPHLLLPMDLVGLGLGAAQVLIAFSYITGLLDRAGSIGLMLLVAAGFVLFPPADAAAQLLYAGIAACLFFVGRGAHLVERPLPPFQSPAWGARAVATLRVLSGLSFLVLGFADKVWNPALGAAFLAERPQFNVLRHGFGLEWFTDERFVLLGGIVEAGIGALLVSGLLTRVVILAMWVPFNLPVPFLPAVEMLGHLPIFGVMYLLLVYGAGAVGREARLPHPSPPPDGAAGHAILPRARIVGSPSPSRGEGRCARSTPSWPTRSSCTCCWWACGAWADISAATA